MGPLHHLYLSPVKFASQADYKAKPQEGNTVFPDFLWNIKIYLMFYVTYRASYVYVMIDLEKKFVTQFS